MKKILLATFVLISNLIFAQCEVTGLSSPKNITICGNGPQNINYNLVAHKMVLFEENFNCGAVCNTNWVTVPNGGDFTNPQMPSPTNDTYFFTTGTFIREFSTGPLDLSNGGKLSFDFIYASGVNNGPDLYDEGIQVQYSLDGINWIDYKYYSPTSIIYPSVIVCLPGTIGPAFFNDWQEVCLDITLPMQSSGTYFKIYQPNVSSACCDHWGLDNIKIMSNDPTSNYYLVNDNSSLGIGPLSGSLTANADTSFVFMASNGINFSYDSLNVQFSNPDSIFITSTTNLSSQIASDGTITIGGLSAGSQVSISNSPNSNSFGAYQLSNVITGLDTGTYYIKGINSDGCESNIISTSLLGINNAPEIMNIVPSISNLIEDVNFNFCINATDVDDVQSSLTFGVNQNPFNGSIINSSPLGCHTYVPNLNYHGLDSFEVYVCDPLLACDTFLVLFSIASVNDAPIAVDDVDITLEEVLVTIAVLANDSDPDGFLDVTSTNIVVPPLNGVVTVDPVTGNVSYDPNLNFNGLDSFQYSVCDNGMPYLCDSAWVFVTVSPVNDMPEAVNDFATTYQNITATIDVTTNDYDIDPFGGIDPATVSILTNSINGIGLVDPTTGEITYTPNTAFLGIDSLKYTVCDLGNPLPALCDTAWVFINVLDLILEGTISSSNSNPLQNSKVYLIDYISATDSVFAVDSTFTDVAGFYQFNGASTNNYIKAVPDLANYANEIPTYYTSSAVFQTANSISIVGGVTNISFSTIAGVNPGGNGFISGIVGNGAGKNTEVGLPISGLSLVLMNDNMEVVKQAITDDQGQFSFDNLEEIEFSIWVDKAGINNLIAPSISLVEESSKENLQFVLHEDYLEYKSTVGIKDISTSNFKVYPNPTTGKIYIEAEKGTYKLDVYNIIGEQVYIQENNKGNIVLDLSTRQFTNGTYILKITNEKGIFYTKFVYR